jgi:chemotaxis protein MotC
MSQRALRLFRALLLCAVGLAPSLAARAAEDQKEPYVLVRQLQKLQEQLAHGSKAAQSAQTQLMAAIPSSFLAADPAVWREPRNARAAVMYLFGGGRPNVIRTVLNRSTLPRDIDPLLKGALAYAEGQDAVARELLRPVDPHGLPPNLGGHLALVEATLLAQTDKAKARKLLDLARLLVPGTLVEEAALRRQIFLESDPATLGSFVFLSRQYLHRFRSSIYAENFKQHLAATAVRLGAAGDLAPLGMIDSVIAELPPAEGRPLYLSMAKAAVVQGHTEAARFAAQRAAAIAQDSSRDSARAQLYASAALIVSADVSKGVAALEAADRSHLSPADADLRDAALAVAHSVTRPVSDSPDAKPGSDEASSGTLAERAKKLIATSDALLEDGAP